MEGHQTVKLIFEIYNTIWFLHPPASLFSTHQQDSAETPEALHDSQYCLLGGWPIVFGSGSWLEAHLVARLALASLQRNLRGCGVTEQEVWDPAQLKLGQGKLSLLLVVTCDSLAADQGLGDGADSPVSQKLLPLNLC